MRVRAREGLGRLGVSSLTASPSLFAPGFVFALPGMLGLRAPWLWLALGITAGPVQGSAWWAAIAIVIVGWMLPGLRQRSEADAEHHPLGLGNRGLPRRSGSAAQVGRWHPAHDGHERRPGTTGPTAAPRRAGGAIGIRRAGILADRARPVAGPGNDDGDQQQRVVTKDVERPTIRRGRS